MTNSAVVEISDLWAVPAENAIGFLETVFDYYEQNRVFAIAKPGLDLGALGIPIRQVELPQAAQGWARMRHAPSDSDAPAQVVFTSGTEGKPKAIVLSHANLADVVTRLNSVMQVTDEIREYIGVPVTYSFGLGRARAVAAAGGAFYLPKRFDPSEIQALLAAGEINAISAVPSLWQTILAMPEVFADVGHLVRWIEIGSQYMSAADKAAMVRLFPKARIVQHYGLTEASRSTFLVISDLQGAEDLESVGHAQGSVKLRITDDEAVAIRGAHVALGQMTPGGQVTPLTDPDGWFVTSDRGALRGGALYYLGRLDDQINIAGLKLGAEALEADIGRILPGAIGHFAVTGIADRARGEAVLLATESAVADQRKLIAQAAELALERRGIASAGVLKFCDVTHLPRTDTNKIQRKLIAVNYDPGSDTSGQSGPVRDQAAVPSRELTVQEARILQSWFKVVKTDQVAPEQSFYDLGGDSLSSVQIGLVMERDGFERPVLRATMEGRPLSEVATLLEAEASTSAVTALPDQTVKSWAVSMTRGIMALSVLLSHWGPGAFGRLGIAAEAEKVLALFYRMGTPGFAAVFGIGVGFFMLPDFAAKRASVMGRLRASFLLVLSGLVLLAVAKLALWSMRGEDTGALQISNALYGVLAYYALMLGTARWWMPALAALRQPLLTCMILAPVIWIVGLYLDEIITSEQQQSLVEWPRLMLSAGYNVFKMTTVAILGVAIGYWVAQQRDIAKTGRILAIVGLAGALFAASAIAEFRGAETLMTRRSSAYVSAPGLLMYVCLVALFLGVFLLLVRAWEHQASSVHWLLKLAIVTGGLALPIYVFHQLVLPVRGILVELGVPGAVALAVPVGLFSIAMLYGGRRLWRMYF